MNRKGLWWAVLVVGVALIVVPLATGMPGKTAAGQRMLDDFQPLMAPSHVRKTAYYYDEVFAPLGQITPVFTAANAQKFQGYLTGMQQSGLKVPPPAAQDFGALVTTMKQAVPVASQVSAGLDWYRPLVRAMQGNVQDYEDVDSLPNFTLFTWFFVLPGILLVLLSGLGLYGGRLTAHAPRGAHAAK